MAYVYLVSRRLLINGEVVDSGDEGIVGTKCLNLYAFSRL